MGFLLHSKMVRDMVTNLITDYIEECRENDSTDHTQFVKDLFTYLRYGELSKNFKKSEKSTWLMCNFIRSLRYDFER